MKHASGDVVSMEVFLLLINVIHNRDGYAFKRCAEAYATNGHILTGLDSYDVTTLKEYEEKYGLWVIIEALELYAAWYAGVSEKEGAEDDGHTAEGTV